MGILVNISGILLIIQSLPSNLSKSTKKHSQCSCHRSSFLLSPVGDSRKLNLKSDSLSFGSSYGVGT